MKVSDVFLYYYLHSCRKPRTGMSNGSQYSQESNVSGRMQKNTSGCSLGSVRPSSTANGRGGRLALPQKRKGVIKMKK